MKRRDFLKSAGALAAGAVLPFPAWGYDATAPVDDVINLDALDASDDLDAHLAKPVTAVIIGAGNRGGVYARYADRYPGSLSIVGVSDINDFRREKMGDKFNVPADKRFGDWSEVFEQPRMADAIILTTPDKLHYEPCMKALAMGYDVLLEKPVAQTEKECIDILRQTRKYGRIVAVCHVLRYAPYYAEIKRLVASGAIGDVVSVQHFEGVEVEHMCHSFVRGNWRNSIESNPMIVSKSCHDLDILRWIVDRPCEKATAFGGLRLFRSENAPAGSALRCLDCKIVDQCAFSAQRIYLEKRKWATVFDFTSEDEAVRTREMTEKLRTNPYGRCVYHCDNDQPDHYVMNMEFEGGVTAAFSMEGLTSYGIRFTRIMGTRGDIVGDMSTFTLTEFLSGKKSRWEGDAGGGHGGGDLRLARDFVQAVATRDESKVTSSIEASIESHVMGFRAEEARKSNTIADTRF